MKYVVGKKECVLCGWEEEFGEGLKEKIGKYGEVYE